MVRPRDSQPEEEAAGGTREGGGDGRGGKRLRGDSPGEAEGTHATYGGSGLITGQHGGAPPDPLGARLATCETLLELEGVAEHIGAFDPEQVHPTPECPNLLPLLCITLGLELSDTKSTSLKYEPSLNAPIACPKFLLSLSGAVGYSVATNDLALVSRRTVEEKISAIRSAVRGLASLPGAAVRCTCLEKWSVKLIGGKTCCGMQYDRVIRNAGARLTQELASARSTISASLGQVAAAMEAREAVRSGA